jgi:hypothetical protein
MVPKYSQRGMELSRLKLATVGKAMPSMFHIVKANDDNLVAEVGRGPKITLAEVRTEVRVEWGLASAYRLRPPLRAAPRFRDKDKRRGSR